MVEYPNLLGLRCWAEVDAASNSGSKNSASTSVCWAEASMGVVGSSRRAGQRSAWAGDTRGCLYCGSDLGRVARLSGAWWTEESGHVRASGTSDLGRLAVSGGTAIGSGVSAA